MMTDEQHRKEGIDAYNAGTPRSSNPYSYGASSVWDAGWQQANQASIESRTQDAADEIMHTLCRVASTATESNPEYSSVNIASAVIDAYKEIGDAEDEDALLATTLSMLAGHDPETRA